MKRTNHVSSLNLRQE